MLARWMSSWSRRLSATTARRRRRRLCTPDELRWILERECARSDRTGEVFSLLILEPRDTEDAELTYRYLTKLFGRRLRITDDAGWFDQRRIGVVLPCTPPAGAWKLSDDLVLMFPDRLEPPHPTVYSYPHPSDREESEEESERDPVSLPLQPLLAYSMPKWKRAIDLCATIAGGLVLLPLLAVVALLIKLSSPGPVMFTQFRSGLGGRPFRIYKFRTMVVDAERRKSELMALNEVDGPAFKLKRDPRVTRIGAFLRATSLDELPQLWNVIRGDMSLVGPRPLPCVESDGCQPWQRRRLDVTPGLTCIWQISGRSNVRFEDWMRMDLLYQRTSSPWRDISLLFRTIPAVLLRRGAY